MHENKCVLSSTCCKSLFILLFKEQYFQKTMFNMLVVTFMSELRSTGATQ